MIGLEQVPKSTEGGTAGRCAMGLALCGGRSRRMGADKARLSAGAETLLERTVRILGQIAPRVVLACGPTERYRELGLPLALDGWRDAGPLAGLLAGLEEAHRSGLDARDAVAVLAVDLPRVEAEVLAALARRQAERDLDVCLLETPAGLEPLLGVVRVGVRGAIERALSCGGRRMTSFHGLPGAERVGSLRIDELAPALRARDVARNVNTPDDWLREREDSLR